MRNGVEMGIVSEGTERVEEVLGSSSRRFEGPKDRDVALA